MRTRSFLVVSALVAAAWLGVGSAGGAGSSASSFCARTSGVLARARAEHDPLPFMPPEKALVVRCGTFPIRLYRDGRLVVSGSCFVHAFQYRDYYFIESRLNHRLTFDQINERGDANRSSWHIEADCLA